MPEKSKAGLFNRLAEGLLKWVPELGIGFCDVPAISYAGAYWQNYLTLDDSEMGRALTDARVQFVRVHHGGDIVDIGIGGGKFVGECPRAFGFDINIHAEEWLRKEGKWFDPYLQEIEAASFWDSLEHIPDPRPILRNITRSVFVSIPIFRDAAHVIASKHFKPGEHFWYFTHSGLISFMEAQGFHPREFCRMETDLGREGIGTYYFERPTR